MINSAYLSEIENLKREPVNELMDALSKYICKKT